jgi:large subunit ribosomal protein L29
MTRRIEKFRELNANELELRHRELAEQIFRLRFQLSSGQSEGLKKLREAKKDLARVKTLLRQAQPSRSESASRQSHGGSAAAEPRSERATAQRKG